MSFDNIEYLWHCADLDSLDRINMPQLFDNIFFFHLVHEPMIIHAGLFLIKMVHFDFLRNPNRKAHGDLKEDHAQRVDVKAPRTCHRVREFGSQIRAFFLFK